MFVESFCVCCIVYAQDGGCVEARRRHKVFCSVTLTYSVETGCFTELGDRLVASKSQQSSISTPPPPCAGVSGIRLAMPGFYSGC